MKGIVTEGLEYPFASTRAALRFAWYQLDRRAHIRLIGATVILSLLSVADFLFVLIMAAVAATVVSSFSAEWKPPALDWLPTQEFSPLTAILLAGGGSILVLSLKTIASWYLLRRVYLFTARQKPTISGRIYYTYLSAPFTAAQALSRSQVGAAIGTGSASLIAVIRGAITLATDLVLILLMVCLMLVVDPLLFIASAAYFGLLTVITSRFIGRRMSTYGREALEASVAMQETTLASVGFAPEIRLYGMTDTFTRRLAHDELRAATVTGLQQVLLQAPKYVFDLGVLVGFVFVAAVAFVTQGPAEASFTVALFALTSARLVPAIQRMNGSWGAMKFSRAQTYALLPILELPPPPAVDRKTEANLALHTPAAGSVILEGVGYQYPATDEWALQDVDLTIAPGSTVALVGRTGSGKSTLAGIIAGLIEPSSGSVLRGGGNEWQSGLAIVPQDVFLAPDSVANNVALPVLGDASDEVRIWRALEMAQVADIVARLPDGLDTHVGEDGSRFSGGERQRLGLARALYRNPDMLILDEATSSLDAHTERRVAEAVRSASVDCTLIVVAHRLSTIRDADQIVYLEDGRVVAKGDFREVSAVVPAFAEAARLQGLNLGVGQN